VARKSPNDTAKEKAAKQKKMVIILGVVLAGAVAFAAHTMMGMSGGSPASAPQAADPNATTTPASTPAPAAPTGSALPAAPSLGSLAPATATPSASTSSPLVSAVQAPVGTGQLQSFSLFESKDPFHTGGPGTGAAASSPSSPSGGTSSGSGKAPKTPPAPPAPPPTSAVISVNGSSESVASGSNFPAASPVFQLLSLTATTAKISVVGGSYASGAGTLTLKVNRSVTLVNTADGTRYTLLLMPQGTQASASGAAAAAPGPTTTTTPVTGG
jgi:hypothetical protein